MTVSVLLVYTPPPKLFEPVALLPEIVLRVMVKLPAFQTPPPASVLLVAVLPEIVISLSVVMAAASFLKATGRARRSST